ncbi:nucleotidyltransferase family protein [Brucella gallinifaecis]|uniref:Nucleotidyltransferase family protein n=1 Tax=Brucella gallinifaecis TaxID=215590 RepID=A0A502BKJ9_9HYPH|nr:nucleotidyltransferase family protein [Brucella gallinifaecis]TPF74357.1 nucleotidyltransferase family protein [Brucella gallinifaecis]
MSGTAKIAVIVLAAGQSRRFGARDKLLSHYSGKPLASHVAASLQGVPFAFGVVVARNPSVAGLFTKTRLRSLFPKSTSTQSQTLKAGLQYVKKRGASHALLVLGDMPNITHKHLKKIITKAGVHPVISYDQVYSLPPALIPRQLFGKLQNLRGDMGAGKILMKHPSIIRIKLDRDQAMDIDYSLKNK